MPAARAGSGSRQRRIARSIAGSMRLNDRVRRRQMPALMLFDELVERGRRERAAAGEELVKHEAERVDVAARRDLAAEQLLRAPCRRACRHGCLRRRRRRRGRNPSAALCPRRRASRWRASDRGAARRARARRRGRRKAAARSRSPCLRGSGRCGGATTRGPRRRRTPSTGRGGRRPRRCRRRGRCSDARPAARSGPRCGTARAAPGRAPTASGRNFSATGWPRRRSSAR